MQTAETAWSAPARRDKPATLLPVDLQDRRLARRQLVEARAACAPDSRRPDATRPRRCPATNSRAPAIGLIRVASNSFSQGLSLPSIRSAIRIAAAVPLEMPQALKPVATR